MSMTVYDSKTGKEVEFLTLDERAAIKPEDLRTKEEERKNLEASMDKQFQYYKVGTDISFIVAALAGSIMIVLEAVSVTKGVELRTEVLVAGGIMTAALAAFLVNIIGEEILKKRMVRLGLYHKF